jgi:hypothetical protein
MIGNVVMFMMVPMTQIVIIIKNRVSRLSDILRCTSPPNWHNSIQLHNANTSLKMKITWQVVIIVAGILIFFETAYLHGTPQSRASTGYCDPETGRDTQTGQACGPDSRKLCPPMCTQGFTCLFHQIMCSLGIWH